METVIGDLRLLSTPEGIVESPQGRGGVGEASCVGMRHTSPIQSDSHTD